MKHVPYLLVAASLIAGPAFAAGPSVEKQIRALEDSVNAAYQANDLPHYFSFYAEDLQALFPEGRTGKADYVKSWTSFVKAGGHIGSFIPSGMQVQVSPAGDVAVATYQATVRTFTPGKPAEDESMLETDVWMHRAGGWKIVTIQYGAFVPAK